MLALSWCAGLALTLFWWWTSPVAFWLMLVSATLVFAAGLLALHGWLHAPQGRLAWDGAAWRWESLGYQTGIATHRVFVVADFQSWLVLRLENHANAVLWLWVGRSAMPERWPDLRRAVHGAPQIRPAMTMAQQEPGRGSPAHPVAGAAFATPGELPLKT